MASEKPRKSRSGSARKSARKTAGKGAKKSPVKSGRTCVVVLGMHRSGTSMLTGILGRLGCNMAEHLMPANFANERGYYESAPISVLNDEIFKSSGTVWNDWQQMHPGWFTSAVAEEFHDRALKLIDDEFGTSRLFVLKDPRICRLMPFWREVFAARGIALRVLHIHRNPLEVAASLEARDGLDPDYGLLLWLRNVLEAEAQTRDLPRHFTSFREVMANWAGVTEACAQTLDLSWPRMSARVAAEVQEFILPDLKHFNVPSEQLLKNPLLPEWVRDAFEILERWVRGEVAKDDMARLDVIRAELDQSVGAFAGLLEEAKRAAGMLTQTQGDLEKARAESVQLKTAEATARTEIEALTAKAAQAETTTRETAKALEAARAESVQLKTAEATARTEIEALTAKAAQAETTARETATALDQARAESVQLKTAEAAARTEIEALTAKAAQAETTTRETAKALEAARAESVQLKTAEATARTEIEALTAKAAQAETTARETATALDQARVESARLKTAEATARTEIEALTAKAAQAETTTRETAKALDQARQDKAAQAAKIQAQTTAAAALRAERDAAQHDLDTAHDRIAGLERQLDNNASELEQRRAESDHWAERVSVLDDDLAQMRQRLAQREAEATHWIDRTGTLEEQLAQAALDHRADRHALERRLAQMQEREEAQRQRARDTEAAVERRMAAMRAQADAGVERLQTRHGAELDRKAAETATLYRALDDARAQMEALLYEKEQVLGSTSWRVTAPLRWLVRALRR